MSQEPLQNYYSLDQALFRVESEEIKLLEGFSNKKATNKSHNLFFKFLCTSFHLYFYTVKVRNKWRHQILSRDYWLCAVMGKLIMCNEYSFYWG